MAELSNKIVLVTGAAGGIGTAICRAIAQAGGIALASDLEGRADVALDVTSEDDWRRVHDDIAREHGRLDGLLNAAGVVALGSIEELDLATWRRVLTIN